jgi:tetratricopeptide repeat protein 30
MRKIEREEEKVASDKQCFHLCIVNLVIGTLYCAKGNFEFGISRIVKSLEPYEKKLGTDTWFYAKRCFLALAECQAKHIATLKDTTFIEILSFLDAADQHGKDIFTIVSHSAEDDNQMDPTKHNVSFEARQMKKLFLKLCD